jgi:hypothetical protein
LVLGHVSSTPPPSLVSDSKVSQIVVDLSGLNSQTAWQSAARDAISHWSGIGYTTLQMSEGSPADITVSTTCTSSNVAAFASFPSGGNPGSTIYVNTCFGYSTTHAQKVHNMVHELGHTIGFRHSNYVQMGESAGTEGAIHIAETPTSGNATGSVMNGGTALNSWAGFAWSDVFTTRTLYPVPGPYSPSVTHSNGTPLLHWAAVPGATSYTVSLIYYEMYDNINWEIYYISDPQILTTTTSTSYLDTGNVYTGSHECMGYGYYYFATYAVRATFPNGSTSENQVLAPIGPC